MRSSKAQSPHIPHPRKEAQGPTTTVLIGYPWMPHYRRAVFDELIAQPDFSVSFVAGHESCDGTIATIDAATLSYHHVDNVWLGRWLWQRGLVGHLWRTKPDVYLPLGDAQHLSTWVTAALARLRGTKVVMWTIGWHRPERGVHKFIRTSFYRLAHHLAIYGEYGRDLGLAHGFPAKRMSVVGNSAPLTGHDKPPLGEAFTASLPTGDRPVITSVIRLNPAKKLDLILHAADELGRSGLPVDVCIVGEGPDRERLLTRARDLGVRLFLPGAAYHEKDIQQVYERATVSVIPEAGGLTVLQSLAHGVPVVTCREPHLQMPESEAIIDGVTGSLFPAGNVVALTDAIRRWLEQSPAERFDTAHKARSSLQGRWTAHGQAHLIATAVRSLLGRRASDVSRTIGQGSPPLASRSSR